jgi:hypothetical protein
MERFIDWRLLDSVSLQNDSNGKELRFQTLLNKLMGQVRYRPTHTFAIVQWSDQHYLKGCASKQMGNSIPVERA